MRTRFFAHVQTTAQAPTVRHLVGLPPDLTGGNDQRVGLPWPCILLLEESDRGSWMLYRYSQEGTFGGDTWHENIEHAHEQAAFEFGDQVGEWREVPEEIEDAIAYALSQIPPARTVQEPTPIVSELERLHKWFEERLFSDSAELIRKDRER